MKLTDLVKLAQAYGRMTPEARVALNTLADANDPKVGDLREHDVYLAGEWLVDVAELVEFAPADEELSEDVAAALADVDGYMEGANARRQSEAEQA